MSRTEVERVEGWTQDAELLTFSNLFDLLVIIHDENDNELMMR